MNVSKHICGTCVDCGRACRVKDDFIVRSSVWEEAGMNGWHAGFLHLRCLEARLGRKLKWGIDLLVMPDPDQKSGKSHCRKIAHPDYLKSPEFLEHGSVT